MLAVLSPAKRLDFETAAPADLPHTKLKFRADTEELLETTRRLKASDLSRLMNISDGLAELNEARFKNMRFPFNKKNAKHAILAFRGDTYVGFDADSLSTDELRYAQDRIRILSGLYGLLRPLDLIQPYRLEMGTALTTDRGSDLYAFWGKKLADALNRELKKSPSATLVNLASVEYFKAVDADRIRGRIISPVFKEKKNGTAKIVSFSAKKARGMMAKFIVARQIEDPADLSRFNFGGYRYQKRASTPDRPEFWR